MKKNQYPNWVVMLLSVLLALSICVNGKLWDLKEQHYNFAVYAQDAFRGALGHQPSWAEFCLYSTKGGRMRTGE